jgi:hypothetical protein
MKIADVEGHTVVERIKCAFADTEHPGDEAIPGRPDYLDEAEEEFRQLRGRRWEDLDLVELPALSSVLMWLSSDGLRYYLPAFLAAAVVCPASVGSRDIIGFLAPPAAKGRSQMDIAKRVAFRRFVDELTPEQKRVVRETM